MSLLDIESDKDGDVPDDCLKEISVCAEFSSLSSGNFGVIEWNCGLLGFSSDANALLGFFAWNWGWFDAVES